VCDLENVVYEEAMTRVGSQRHKKKFLEPDLGRGTPVVDGK
jgi:hypothetical protein